jgi:hypothetical protein
MPEVMNWLLEDNNPAVKYRTQTELLGEVGNKESVVSWIINKLPKNWIETKGLWFTYYITAFAESGLSYEDMPKEAVEKAFAIFDETIDCGCADFMLLTALLKLGLENHPAMKRIIDELKCHSLPDGGYVCNRIMNKLDYTPKSCYKADLHALLFVAECKKKGIDIMAFQPLIDYFFSRNLFYKSDKTTFVMNDREGWRTVDTFYPFESMRVGLQNVVEAFCALGYCKDERLLEAWNLIEKHKDDTGKYILKGTLTNSYLPKTGEKEGKPSKRVTFYVLLAKKESYCNEF